MFFEDIARAKKAPQPSLSKSYGGQAAKTKSITGVSVHNATTPLFCGLFGPVDYKKVFSDQLKPKDVERFTEIITNKACELFTAGNLALFDGIADNNQCHLSAAYMLDCVRDMRDKRLVFDTKEPAKLLQQPEVRCLALSFFLSSVFHTDAGKSLMTKILPGTTISGKTDINKFKIFCSVRSIRDRAKHELSKLLRDFTRICARGSCEAKAPASDIFIDDLAQELHAFSIRDDLVLDFDAHTDEKEPVFQCPKFPGALIFLEKTKKSAMPIVLNIKVLCDKGVHHTRLLFHADRLISEIEFKKLFPDDNAPVIVIEGVSCPEKMGDELCTFDMYKLFREHCSQGLLAKKTDVHPIDTTCRVCRPCPDDKACELFCSKVAKLHSFESFSQLLLPNAADFTAVIQPAYVSRFFATEMPELVHIQKLFVQKLRESRDGLCSENPTVLAIEHVHPDLLCNAVRRRFLDTRPEDILTGAGL